MEILQKDYGNKGAFYIMGDTEVIAQMDYVWAGKDRIIIDHTFVDETLKGKGIGKQMVTKAIEFARKNGINIIPLCPFARSVFNKVTEFNDVL